jgi:hypothetical protein
MIMLLTTSLIVTSWHDCWFQVARSVQSGDHFLQADFQVLIRTVPILDYFRIADHPAGISVSLQVEHKQSIGNGHLIGSSLR